MKGIKKVSPYLIPPVVAASVICVRAVMLSHPADLDWSAWAYPVIRAISSSCWGAMAHVAAALQIFAGAQSWPGTCVAAGVTGVLLLKKVVECSTPASPMAMKARDTPTWRQNLAPLWVLSVATSPAYLLAADCGRWTPADEDFLALPADARSRRPACAVRIAAARDVQTGAFPRLGAGVAARRRWPRHAFGARARVQRDFPVAGILKEGVSFNLFDQLTPARPDTSARTRGKRHGERPFCVCTHRKARYKSD
ncbi:hypothetical protein BN2476_830093 [Paraburkholderia piptadeniae]|uniref:Uncharacterized protein n=1 Tax=Paraburkholderia piptadeniae TaxID=1701573 RepID=A0A1N7ST45_9BURK|nr:hypothetical protein [Paraburkholderia piptadeniae]SIT50522.1 hypothetical protein BN2476_830093 [Paraburkholderia piptadeniae]